MTSADLSPRDGRIGRYRMLGLLATGGMAEVYLALSGELTGFRTLAVVKRILPHLASNADFIRMFFDEARIVALLDHPNIVRILEVGQDGDEYFLAMEVIQGKSLSALVRKTAQQNVPLSHTQAAFLVAQAANGVGHAHNLVDAAGRPMNVVHRDVSPQNILVSYEGAVKVIDFGVARALGRATETRPGGLKGKIHYMAPEQAAAGHVDRRSDVFALGIVLWEALCGRRPFRRENDLETLRAIAEERVPPPSKFVKISARLESIVMRALQRDPGDRYQTAQEMALALERYAFASQGFDPAQLGNLMKSTFASDLRRWKKTVATVMELEGEPDDWINTSGTYLRPQTIDLKTRGTVSLERSPRRRSTSVSTHDVPSASQSIPSGHPSSTGPPAAGERRRSFLGVTAAWGATVVLVGTMAFIALSRPGQMVTVAGAMQEHSSAERATVQVEALPPPNPEAVATSAPPAMSPSEPAAPSASSDASLAEAGVANRQRGRGNSRRAATERTLSRASKSTAPRRRPASRAVHASPSPSPSPSSSSASSNDRAAAVTACSLRVGTLPWSEVWIDDRNTKMHTPYMDRVPCGKHKLTFKREDLGLSRTVEVILAPGETIKRAFSLEQD